METLIELIKVILLGIIQGVTEWLPISSTGHMILFDEFIRLNITPEFREMFFVVIQLGSILAVVVLFFKKLNPFVRDKEKSKDTWIMWFKVAVAAVPAAVIGLLFNDLIDDLFFNYMTVALMLILYGILFIVIENRNKNREPKVNDIKQLSFKTALLIGVFQTLALIPGTSRSGATIIGGIILGASRYVAAEFSFFLAIPVMFGASLLKVIEFGLEFTTMEIVILLLGSIVAFVVSLLVIKSLMAFVKKHDFKVFGYYRIVLGAIVLVYFLLR